MLSMSFKKESSKHECRGTKRSFFPFFVIWMELKAYYSCGDYGTCICDKIREFSPALSGLITSVLMMFYCIIWLSFTIFMWEGEKKTMPNIVSGIQLQKFGTVWLTVRLESLQTASWKTWKLYYFSSFTKASNLLLNALMVCLLQLALCK